MELVFPRNVLAVFFVVGVQDLLHSEVVESKWRVDKPKANKQNRHYFQRVQWYNVLMIKQGPGQGLSNPLITDLTTPCN